MRYLQLALLPLLFVACSYQAPVEPIEEEGPAFNFINNPDVGNFKVFRGQFGVLFCWSDPATGLRACHSTHPLGDPDCGLQSVEDPIDWQELLINEETFRYIANAVGEVFITVRDLTMPGTCFGNALVGEGWGRFHYTDNDEFGSVVRGGANTNAWGFSATGDLLTPLGAPLKYSGHARFTWNPPEDEDYREHSLKVNVH